jgi:hypothetical protein
MTNTTEFNAFLTRTVCLFQTQLLAKKLSPMFRYPMLDFRQLYTGPLFMRLAIAGLEFYRYLVAGKGLDQLTEFTGLIYIMLRGACGTIVTGRQRL